MLIRNVIVGAVGVAVVAFVGAWAYCPPKNSGELASWVQGAGTILAVLASLGIVSWQSARERARAQTDAAEEHLRQLDAACEIVGGTAQVLRKIANLDHSDATMPDLYPVRGELLAITEALAAIDLSRLGGHKVVEGVLVTLGVARATLSMIDAIDASSQGWLRWMNGGHGNMADWAAQVEDRAKALVLTYELAELAIGPKLPTGRVTKSAA